MGMNGMNMARRRSLYAIRMIAASVLLLPGVVHAGIDIDDLLSITWEGLWHESGIPVAVRKWNKPLSVRISGDPDRLQKRAIDESLKEIAEASGLRYSVLDNDDDTPNLIIDVVRESPKLGPNVPCVTQIEPDGNGIVKATVTAKREAVDYCILHELGHVIGITGHPYGRTVMTYFNRRNELSDYDRFIIKARYSRDLRHGASPLRALRVIGERYLASPLTEEERARAGQRIAEFKSTVLREMKKFAVEKGEPPLVIFRSGRISMQAMEIGRTEMQYYLGNALFDGDLDVTDPGRGADLLRKAAANKSQPAAWSLAWRYQEGKGFDKDPVQSYAWYAYAASLGNPAAQKRQKRIEEALSETDLSTYRQAAVELQASITGQTTSSEAAQ